MEYRDNWKETLSKYSTIKAAATMEKKERNNKFIGVLGIVVGILGILIGLLI